MKAKNVQLIILSTMISSFLLSGCGKAAGPMVISVPINNSSTKASAPASAVPVKSSLSIDLNPKIYSSYYISRVASFMNSNSDQGKIVFLGDSLTEMNNWSEMMNNPNIVNRGISNDTTSGVFNRLSEIVRLKPEKIFIMIGINDIGKGLFTEDITINLSGILDIIKTELPDTTIYVESVLPINKDIFKTGTEEKQITDLNFSLNKLCERYKVKFIDLYPLFTVSKDKLNPDYTDGGLHISKNGYKVWSEAIKEYCK